MAASWLERARVPTAPVTRPEALKRQSALRKPADVQLIMRSARTFRAANQETPVQPGHLPRQERGFSATLPHPGQDPIWAIFRVTAARTMKSRSQLWPRGHNVTRRAQLGPLSIRLRI